VSPARGIGRPISPVFALVLALLTLSAIALPANAAWIPLAGGAPGARPQVTVVESSASRIVLDYVIPGFDAEPVTIDGKTFYRITLPHEGNRLAKGMPDLPHVCRSVIIPDAERMRVRVTQADTQDFPGMPVAPSKGNILRTVDPATVAYTFDPTFYGASTVYPASMGEGGSPYIFRDYRGMVVEALPFQAHAAGGTLTVARRIRIEITTEGPDETNAIHRAGPPASVVADFDDIYRLHFLNYGMDRYTPVPEIGSILIFCYAPFHDAMQPYVQWKNMEGIPTAMYDVGTQIPNDSATFQQLISNYYYAGGLAHVILVGDAEQVASMHALGGAADPRYSLIAGYDRYPEVIVGRFSAENVQQLTTQVARTVSYEKTPAAGAAWYAKGTGIGSAGGPGDDGEYDWQHEDVIRGKLLNYGYTWVDQIYDPGATAAQVTAALNDGRSIVNYTGHGGVDGWSTSGFISSDVANLSNDSMLPFIVSVGCQNGNFEGRTCFGEAWLRSTRNGNPIGAIGTYMSSIDQSWSPPMSAQDAAVDLLVVHIRQTFGGLCYNGSCQMMDEYGYTNGGDMFITWHIFGDPSLMVRTKPPVAMSVQHSGTMDVGQSTYMVVTLPGARCALYANGTLYGAAFANDIGYATIPLNPPPTGPMTLTLTVTAFDRIPVIAPVEVGYMADGSCTSSYGLPHKYRFTQQHIYWSVVGVLPGVGDDKDITVYNANGDPLASSTYGTGADFVVGDFNHDPLSTYYPTLSYGNTTTPYVVEWDDGADMISPGADVSGTVGGGSGDCGAFQVWDVNLQAGKTYRIDLMRTWGTADVRFALLRNPGSSPYWAGRYSAEVERGTDSPYEYSPPSNDFYGLVVFNNSQDMSSAGYTLRLQEAPVPLTSGSCQNLSVSPKMFSFSQQTIYWAAVAVNPAISDDKDIAVYDNPDGAGSPLASSTRTTGTDFVVGDFNSTPTGTYYPRVSYGNTGVAYTVEWEDGSDIISIGADVQGSFGSGPGCGLVRAYDVYLEQGQTYRIALRSAGSATARVCLFRNPASGTYWAGRSSAVIDTGNNDPRTYTAPADDYYGVVVFNDSPASPSGSFTLRITRDPIPLADAACQTSSRLPQIYSYAQASYFWSAVAVNPSGSDDKDIAVFDNPDGFGPALAISGGTSGTDFVIGDFNNTPTGTYYACVYDGATGSPYVVDWEDGSDLVYLGTDVTGTMGGGSGACGLVRVWDVYLTAGKTYRFLLTRTSGSADIRVALFRNPSPSSYFVGRSGSAFESAAGSSVAYTAPASDYYGLVVFNASPDSPSAQYTLRAIEDPRPLSSGVCASTEGSPLGYRIAQNAAYWTGVAVNPTGVDDKNIVLYDNPDGIGTPLGTSRSTAGTDFVVGDFNHNAVGTYYPWVTDGSGASSYIVEWEDGTDRLVLGTPVAGSVGGSGASCGLIRFWDVSLQGSKTYRVTLQKAGQADLRVSFFYNPHSAPYWTGRSGAVFEKGADETPYQFNTRVDDWYGIAVFNNSPGNPASEFTLLLEEVVAARPDLIVADIDIAPSSPTSADSVSVRALVVNQGAGAAPASTTRFWLDGNVAGDLATQALAPGGQIWTAWLPLGLIIAGDHTTQACADAPNLIVEADETNNCRTEGFHVNQASAVDGVSGLSAPGVWFQNPYRPGGPILLRSRADGRPAVLSIYNVQGRLLRTLFNGSVGGNGSIVRWDGSSDAGSGLGTGIYFLSGQVSGVKVKRTILLLR